MQLATNFLTEQRADDLCDKDLASNGGGCFCEARMVVLNLVYGGASMDRLGNSPRNNRGCE